MPRYSKTDLLYALLYERGDVGVSQLEAYDLVGTTRLAALVFRLRDEGYIIRTKMVEGRDRLGQPTRYARYILTRPEDVHQRRSQDQ